MKKIYRPNVYVNSADLSHRLTASAMEGQLKPMPKPIELYDDLKPIDVACYAVWFVLLAVYFYWLSEIL